MTTTYEYQSDFARKYVAQGREEGEAVGRAEGQAVGRAEGQAVGETTALLTVLNARGIEVPADARDRITNCTDLDQLTAWLRLAATATSINDVLP